jgi:very-short-patch-repair endonuclease
MATHTTTDKHLAAVAATQAGSFHRDQATDVGMTREQLRRRREKGQIDALARNVFAYAGSPPTFPRALWAGLLDAGEGSAASHRAAAQLHQVPGFNRSIVDITQVRAEHRRTELATVHQTFCLPTDHITTVQGVPATTLARTIFDLAAWSSPKRIVHGWPHVPLGRVARTLDLAQRELAFDLDRLDEVLEDMARHGTPGVQIVRMLLDERSTGYNSTDTALERLLLDVLRRFGAPLPDTQAVIGGDLPVGRVDFWFRGTRIVIEADSRKYHLRLTSHDDDLLRDQKLIAAGFIPIRVTWKQLRDDPAGFVARVLAALERG